jgi:hypothetical protein
MQQTKQSANQKLGVGFDEFGSISIALMLPEIFQQQSSPWKNLTNVTT